MAKKKYEAGQYVWVKNPRYLGSDIRSMSRGTGPNKGYCSTMPPREHRRTGFPGILTGASIKAVLATRDVTHAHSAPITEVGVGGQVYYEVLLRSHLWDFTPGTRDDRGLTVTRHWVSARNIGTGQARYAGDWSDRYLMGPKEAWFFQAKLFMEKYEAKKVEEDLFYRAKTPAAEFGFALVDLFRGEGRHISPFPAKEFFRNEFQVPTDGGEPILGMAVELGGITNTLEDLTTVALAGKFGLLDDWIAEHVPQERQDEIFHARGKRQRSSAQENT